MHRRSPWPDQASTGKISRLTARPGFPGRADVAKRYAELTGRSLEQLPWYQTLALWKAIVFMEGNYKRAITGATDDPYLKRFGDGVVDLAELAERVAHGG